MACFSKMRLQFWEDSRLPLTHRSMFNCAVTDCLLRRAAPTAESRQVYDTAVLAELEPEPFDQVRQANHAQRFIVRPLREFTPGKQSCVPLSCCRRRAGGRDVAVLRGAAEPGAAGLDRGPHRDRLLEQEGGRGGAQVLRVQRGRQGRQPEHPAARRVAADAQRRVRALLRQRDDPGTARCGLTHVRAITWRFCRGGAHGACKPEQRGWLNAAPRPRRALGS